MRRKPLVSSSIASVGYDRLSATLEVEFVGGAVYRYHLVPTSLYEALLAAESPGRFLNAEIRDRYPVEQVED